MLRTFKIKVTKFVNVLCRYSDVFKVYCSSFKINIKFYLRDFIFEYINNKFEINFASPFLIFK